MNEKKKPILGQEAVTDARTLGTPRMLILGLQHLFAMFGATVLVPILVQGYGLPLSIQTTLLMAGLGTLLFHVCTKFKVPAFLGSSFAYLGGFSTVASMPAYDGLAPELKLAYALGGIVIAGLLYLVLALLFKVLGAKTVMRYFPPIVTGPMIIMIGLNLSGSAIKNAATCWWLALVAMAIIIVANIWGRGMAQPLAVVSPKMHAEFDIAYMQEYFRDFGLVYYGCCEPLSDKIDILRQIPNLRKISITPWADVRKAAEQMGKDYVMAWKPNPALVASPDLEEEAVRAEIRNALSACRASGTSMEITLKDISSVAHRPQNLARWAQIAMEMVQSW